MDIISFAKDENYGIIGMLATITSIYVQVLKKLLPKEIPTKILTTITAIIITFVYSLTIKDFSFENIMYSIFGGTVVSFISMFGFDSVKEIMNRYIKTVGDD